MFCIHCGKQLPDDWAFCDQCGRSTQPACPPAPTPPTPVYAVPAQPSMKWFRFLIYFFLFFNATGCIIDGVTTALGLEHENAALLYHAVPGLQIFEIGFGVLEVLLGAFGVFTRFRLSGYYRNGPKLLTAFFIASCAWELLYLVGNFIFMPGMYTFTDAYSILAICWDITTTLAFPLVLLFTNLAYFKKRTYLFTK